ncbi:MAG: transposase [Deltaproteobacteria bacterium]|nr:transposase [Deltaproteobacteria bacterium]
MPRIARATLPYYPHHITQRGNNRADVFFDDEDRKYYIETLAAYCEKCGVAIWAYCLMPNHVHLLTVPENNESLGQGIGRTNQLYTRHVNRKYKRSGRLWQNRFFSTIVDSDVYLWAVARYIEQNPVKAHLVQRPEDYQWSSCKANIRGESDDLMNMQAWLSDKDREMYRIFLQQRDLQEEQRIRCATSTGRPLGNEEFVLKLERQLSRRLLPRQGGRPFKKRHDD